MTRQTKRLISGVMILSFSGLIVKLINILYKWPLTNMVGLTTMGYFNTIYPTYLVLTAASLVGIPATISKLVAEEREAGRIGAAHQIFRAGLLCSSTLGIVSGIIFLVLPSYANLLAWEPEIRYVLWGLAIAPLMIAVSGAIRGYFQGMQNMVPTAVSQIVENVFKVALGVGLVYLLMKQGQPDYISISGATIGISLGFVLATAYLIWQYYRLRSSFLDNGSLLSDQKMAVVSKEADRSQHQQLLHNIRKILWIAIPITISSAMVSIMGFVDSVMIYHVLGAIGFSQETARTIHSSVTTAQTVINVPLAISAALAVSVLPAIAVAGVRRDQTEMNDKINAALQLATKVALPSTVGIFLLAGPILTLLYREKIDASLLQIYSICMLFMILAQSVSSILQGLSGYYKTLLAVVIAVAFKIGSNLLLMITGLGGAALIWSSLIYFMIIFGINYYFLKKETKLTLDRGRIIWKPLLASICMGVAVWLSYYGSLSWLSKNKISVILSVMVAIPVYVIVMLLLKGFTVEEILILPKGQKVLSYLHRKNLIKEE
ncbi:polysaccharide biosynthesis protein [Clostridiales bacterium COT073_COT-073]|nr:polysaccharide biosynthesis protein [Clostridiales bacterium COT073_COT-073]